MTNNKPDIARVLIETESSLITLLTHPLGSELPPNMFKVFHAYAARLTK